MPNPPALSPHVGSTSLIKPDLGTKRVCPSCGVRFYDLQKRPIECPKCAFAFEPEMLLKQRRTRVPEPVKPVVAEAEDEETEETAAEEPAEAEEFEEEIEDEEEEDDSLLEEVEEDEDDVSGIIDADIEKDEP